MVLVVEAKPRKRIVMDIMLEGLNTMIMLAWMIMRMGWSRFQSSPLSWPLSFLEHMWVQFVFMFLKYEMETLNAGYVVPFEYYKVQPIDKL
jgi:hypothetical protein